MDVAIIFRYAAGWCVSDGFRSPSGVLNYRLETAAMPRCLKSFEFDLIDPATAEKGNAEVRRARATKKQRR